MRLTDRDFATGVTKQDLIHIVITGDTTDSPEGSSYKAPVGQILELYNLPVPNIKLKKGDGNSYQTINYNNTVGSNITLVNTPYLTVNNLSEEQLNNHVWIEMVQYKMRKKRATSDGSRPVGGKYVVQPRIEDDGLGNPINWLQETIKNYYGNDKTLTSRGGIMESSTGTPLVINRHNHTEIDITDFNSEINLGEYFEGRFTYDTISYIPSGGGGSLVDLSNVPVPTTNSRRNHLSQRTKSGNNGTPYQLCYTGALTSLYIAFRYIMYDPYSNGGKGKFIEGPLSQTIKVTNKFFPFIKTSVEGECNVNPAFDIGVTNQLIQCSFVNKP